MYKQIVIVRKDLNMSHGKMAAQVSNASMAFLTHMIKNNTHKVENEDSIITYKDSAMTIPQRYRRPDLDKIAEEGRQNGEFRIYIKPKDKSDRFSKFERCEPTFKYYTYFNIDNNLYDNWLNGSFTKVTLQAKNKNNLLKAVTLAKELGMKENEDYFLIYDHCRTELTPEENDGTTLTCIGFKPMDSETIDKISKKYHMYIN